MLFSSRRNISYPNPLRGDTADIPRDFGAVVAALELDVIYGQGTFASRPVSTGGSPGIQGRIYVATDATPHGFYYDYGTGWDPIGSLGAGSVGTAQLADGAVTTIKIADANVTTAKLADGSVTSAKILDGTIVAADIAAALFPSGGAANGTEAFRAIGAGAGQVVAGNDARLTDVRAPSVGHDPSAYGTVFPSSGLYNGYRFTFFWTPPAGGTIGQDFIHRADLDGTRPWHAVADKFAFILADASLSNNNPVQTDWAASVYNVPRAGRYFIRATGQTDNNTNANSPQPYTQLFVAGVGVADAYGKPGLQQANPESVIEYLSADLAAAATIKLQTALGGSDGTGTYVGTWRSWDFMYSIRKCS